MQLFKSKIKDILVGAIFVVLLVIGSLYDFKISDTLYLNNNWINIFVEIIGKMPFCALALYSCVNLFVLARYKENQALKICFMIIYILGSVLSGMLLFEDFIGCIIESSLRYVIAAGLGIGLFVYLYLVVKNNDVNELKSAKKQYIIIALSFVIIVCLTFLVKELIDRTRFEDILMREGSFTKWYQKGTGGSSMWSGHVAMIAGLFSAIPLIKKYQKKNISNEVYYIILVVLVALVGISRMSHGKHFMSDVALAAIASFVVSKVVTWVVLGFSEDKEEIKPGAFIDKVL